LLVAYRRYASETDTEPQQQASYTYDALSRRTSKTVDGVTTEFVWAGGTMIAEKQGTTIRRYFYDGLTPILMEEGGQTYQFQTDHLSTPRQMTDTLDNVVWTARLDAYGKVTNETGTVVNNLRFPGQYHDRETGLYYNWHRYYSPELGRYITSDPIGLEGGLNTYAYVGGDPVNAVDPMGLEVLVCMDPAFGGDVPFNHYWIKTDKYEVGMGGDGRGPLGTGATIVDHTGRSDEPGATCRAPKIDVKEECVDRHIEATIDEPFGHWFPPVNYCKTYVGWVLMQCKTN
jgi:RHS repeat-associated protein